MSGLFGAGIGLGLCMILWSWRVHRDRAIDVTLRRCRTNPADLAVCERDERSLAAERVLLGCVGLALPAFVRVVTTTFGSPLPLSLCLVLSMVGGVTGFQYPAWQLRERARVARRDFRASMSAYLDLVSILLAGGAGIETALVAAARIGDGPSFSAVARCLDVARTARRSPWDVLAEHGTRIGVDELPQLASTIRLGGEQGARMTASLVAKAQSMRAKQMADVEARANSATERMGVPMVLLFLGFLLLLGYPAMNMIGAGFGT